MALLLLLVAAVFRLWLMPLGSSFWVDEMATVFVAQHGGDDPSLAVAPQVPESIYYALPRAAAAVFGSSEIAYRLPSILAMGIALLLVARLAARLIHPAAAWFAVFACLALSGIDYQAADARPYGLGTCISAAAVFFLVRWLDTALWRHAFGFVLLAALLWRVHLIYWPFYAVFLAYTLFRLARRESRVSWRGAAVAFAILAAALAPVLVNALALLRQAASHVIVQPPSLRVLEHALRWNLVLFCALGAWFLARVFRWSRVQTGVAGSALLLILGWWLFQPAGLFAFSWITGDSVFISRYLYVMLPGVALSATAAVSRFAPPAAWKNLAILLGVGVLLYMGNWRQLWPRHGNSDWRDAAEAVNRLAAPDTNVICPSPFIEARVPAWRPDYRLPGFLYCHLSVYPVRGKIRLFPFATSPDAERYAASLAPEASSGPGRFLIYGGAGAARFWRKWFAARPELQGWSFRQRVFGDVVVVEFDPPGRR